MSENGTEIVVLLGVRLDEMMIGHLEEIEICSRTEEVEDAEVIVMWDLEAWEVEIEPRASFYVRGEECMIEPGKPKSV